jgi:hypothetical protein
MELRWTQRAAADHDRDGVTAHADTRLFEWLASDGEVLGSIQRTT